MPDHVINARLHIAEMLDAILADGRVVIVSKDEDGCYAASASPGRGPTSRHSAAATLEGCIEGLTDHPRERKCLRCGESKLLWAFGPDRDSADGHAGTCRQCEARRIGEIGKRKK